MKKLVILLSVMLGFGWSTPSALAKSNLVVFLCSGAQAPQNFNFTKSARTVHSGNCANLLAMGTAVLGLVPGKWIIFIKKDGSMTEVPKRQSKRTFVARQKRQKNAPQPNVFEPLPPPPNFLVQPKKQANTTLQKKGTGKHATKKQQNEQLFAKAVDQL